MTEMDTQDKDANVVVRPARTVTPSTTQPADAGSSKIKKIALAVVAVVIAVAVYSHYFM